MAAHLETYCAAIRQHRAHFFHCVRLLYSIHGIVTGYRTSIERHPSIDQCQVHWVPDEIVNEHSNLCHSESLAGKVGETLRRKVMGKKGTAYQVKSIVVEGKCKGIRYHAWNTRWKV